MDTKKRSDGIRIRVSGLSNGLHEYHFSVEPSEIGLDAGFSHPVTVDVTLDKTTRQIYLKAAVATTGKFICDRCTDEFDQRVTNTYNVFYVYDEESGSSLPPEEVQVLTPDTVHVDLSDDVRQFVLLSVPLKLLCREDCKGLCPSCGTNWNAGKCACKQETTDSRWKGLEKLLNN
jgi:uncharacterized protein